MKLLKINFIIHLRGKVKYPFHLYLPLKAASTKRTSNSTTELCIYMRNMLSSEDQDLGTFLWHTVSMSLPDLNLTTLSTPKLNVDPNTGHT